jgi:AcrR family transcriptional regulator
MAPKFRRDKERKINEILDAVVKLTHEKGPNNFSINDIPEEAHVSIGTVYRYFPRGKEDILKQILLRNIERLKGTIETEKEATSLEAYWRPILHNMMEVGDKYSEVSDVMIEAAPPDSQFYNELSADLMGFYREIGAEISALPGVIDLPAEQLALRAGLCFNLMKKVLQAQDKVQLFDERNLEEYIMQIVKASFSH